MTTTKQTVYTCDACGEQVTMQTDPPLMDGTNPGRDWLLMRNYPTMEGDRLDLDFCSVPCAQKWLDTLLGQVG